MTMILVLQCMLEALKLANAVIPNIPADVQADAWRRHNELMEWLKDVRKDDLEPGPVDRTTLSPGRPHG